jgi:Tn3 transposase DDE domain
MDWCISRDSCLIAPPPSWLRPPARGVSVGARTLSAIASRVVTAEVAGSRVADQQASVAALHLLQSCLVYINTLMLQRMLTEPAWRARMTEADMRGLTPLVWGHVSPYGAFDLDMHHRLDLEIRQVA